MRIITQLLIACYILVCNISLAQTANYPKADQYPITGSSKTYVYLSGGTSLPGLVGDETMVEVPIGFTFNFAGTNYDKVYASSNCWVSFMNVPYPGSHYYYTNSLANLAKIAPALLPLWDDMYGRSGSSASYKTTGTEPNRVFTLEYKNWEYYSPSSVKLSIQVILYENGGNNQVEYRYKREAGTSSVQSGVIGIANSTSDYKILTSSGSSPWYSLSSNFNSYRSLNRPATNQSYVWGCLTNISATPPTKIICANTSTSFSVSSTNANTYKWQVRTGSGTYQDISDNATYSGSNTSTLSITNATTGMNKYTYRCRMSAPIFSGCAVASNPGTLYVNTSIMTNPDPKVICEGNSTTFSTSAVGSGLSYHWQVNAGPGYQPLPTSGPDYSGVTSPTLTVNSPTGAMSGYLYRCQVSSSTCGVTEYSTDAQLTVNTVPLIVNTLQDNIGCEGSHVTLSVSTTGNGLTYQWQEDAGSGFSNLSNSAQYIGVNTASLKLDNLFTSMTNNIYRCVVSGICGSPVTSNNSILTVYKPTKVVTQPSPTTVVCDSTDLKLTVKAEGGILNYQWMESISNSPFVVVSNFGVFSGANTDTLTFTAPPSAMSGRKYMCTVTGACGTTNSNNATIVINENPEVTQHPADDSVGELHPAYFTVNAIGKNLKYQWQADDHKNGWQNLFDNFAYDGANTATLKVIGTYPDKDGYLYRCIVSGICGDDDTSEFALLTVTPTATNVPAVISTGNDIAVYPNPASGNQAILKINKPMTGSIRVQIVDQLGRIASEQTISKPQNTSIIDISNINTGVYNIVVTETENKSVYTLRFTKL